MYDFCIFRGEWKRNGKGMKKEWRNDTQFPFPFQFLNPRWPSIPIPIPIPFFLSISIPIPIPIPEWEWELECHSSIPEECAPSLNVFIMAHDPVLGGL